MRVDRQVGQLPHDGVLVAASGVHLGLAGRETLLDGVLMRAREARVHEVTDVGDARGGLHLRAVLDRATDRIHIREVNARVDALAEQVQAQGHQVHVAGALALAQQATLDAVRASQEGQLGRGHTGATIIVGVDGQGDELAAAEVAAHPLDLVGEHVRGRTLDGGGQVEDDLAPLARLPHVHDGLTHLEGEVQLRIHENLRGVLEAENRLVAQALLRLRDDLARTELGQLDRLRLVRVEHNLPEHGRRRVVEVNGGAREAHHGLDRALDQLGARLGEHRDRHVLGHRVVLDEGAHEVVVGLRGSGETDFDLLITQLNEQVEHAALAGRIHRLDEGLVAIAQVGGHPARRLRDALGGPLAIRQVHGIRVEERPILTNRHARAGGDGNSGCSLHAS